MFNNYHFLTFILLFALVHTTSAQPQQTQKKTLAVIKAEFDSTFSTQDKGTVLTKLYTELVKGDSLALLTEARTQEMLVSSGMNQSDLADSVGYVRAGQLLGAEYVLVASFEKFGNLIIAANHVYKIPAGEPGKIPVRQRWRDFIDIGIPQLANTIRRDMGILPEDFVATREDTDSTRVVLIDDGAKGSKKLPLFLIVGVVVVGGGVTYAVVSGGGDDGGGGGETLSILPRPPGAKDR